MSKPLIIDAGMWTGLAERLGREMEIAYAPVWYNAFPTSREMYVGSGLPNVEIVHDPNTFMLQGKASHVIVPWIGLNDYEELAVALDLPVFGAGYGQLLETDRWGLKEFLEGHGLPVVQSVLIRGMEALKDYLTEHKDKFIKVSTFRGDLETFHHIDWPSTSVWFHDRQAALGPLSEKILFSVEDPIPDAGELGLDTVVLNGEFQLPSVIGIESKDAAYAGRVIDKFPKPFAPLLDTLRRFFIEQDYSSFFSPEMRITKDGTIFMTDATCRIPSPPGGVLLGSIENLSGVVLDGDSPDFGGTKYLYELILKSDWVQNHWLEVQFPEELARNYSFHNHCMIDGRTWIVPHDSKMVEFGSALGWGSTWMEAKKMCIEAAKALKAYHLSFDEKALNDAERIADDSKYFST